MLNIFRGTSRLLTSQIKAHPVRQASNLFEPDYLAVSLKQTIFVMQLFTFNSIVYCVNF